MAELNYVRDKGGFSCGVYYLEAAILLQGGADVEAVAGAEGPGGAGGWLVVDEYAVSDGAEGVASKLKRPLKSSQAEVRGATVDWQRRLRESSVCGRSLSHK